MLNKVKIFLINQFVFVILAQIFSKVSKLDKYIIKFNGLNAGEYDFNFHVDNDFFSNFEKSEITGGNFNVDVLFIRNINSLELKLHLKGNVIIPCDRCLDDINQDIDFCDNIFVEFGEETNFDTNTDYVVLNSGSQEINISQFIYEFAHFALPLSRKHKDDEFGNSTCNPKMIRILKELKPKESEKIDLRWAKLQEIKNNSNFN